LLARHGANAKIADPARRSVQAVLAALLRALAHVVPSVPGSIATHALAFWTLALLLYLVAYRVDGASAL
jgi:hypothetical protein